MQRKPSLRALPVNVQSDAAPAVECSSSQPVTGLSRVSAGSQVESPFAAAEAADRRLRFGDAASELPSFPEEESQDVSDSQNAVSPVVTWGGAASQGERRAMEDTHIGVTDVGDHLGLALQEDVSRSFFGLFDGHGGTSAAEFARDHLLDLVTKDECFFSRPGEALNSAFTALDELFYAAVTESRAKASGSTLLAALVWGGQLLVANAGDSRAVLCRRGRAHDLSTDHKPSAQAERNRIAEQGGYVCPDGFLNGQLGVSRSIGDYHLDGMKMKPSVGQALEGPLTAEPEISVHSLMAEDEFIVMACDGLWDVLSSQRAVELARGCLQRNNNDPTICAQMLVDTSLNMHASDNVTVLVVCLTLDVPPKREYGPRDKVRRSFSQNGLDTLRTLLEGDD